MEIFGFEVNHEYIIQYVEAVEHNSWTFEVHFDTFSVFQTVWGILYQNGFNGLKAHLHQRNSRFKLQIGCALKRTNKLRLLALFIFATVETRLIGQ